MFLGSACAWAQDANGNMTEIMEKYADMKAEKIALEKEKNQLELDLKEANATITRHEKEIDKLKTDNENLTSTLVAPKELKALQDSVDFYKKKAENAQQEATRKGGEAEDAKRISQDKIKEMNNLAAQLDQSILWTCFAFPLEAKYNQERIDKSIETAKKWVKLGASSEDLRYYLKMYEPLLTNYGKYNTEVYGVLEKAEKWANAAGGLKQEVSSAIVNEIKRISYYKVYNRADKEMPSIQHLDNILDDLKFLMQKGGSANDVSKLKKRMNAPAKPAVTEQPEATSEEHSANGANNASNKTGNPTNQEPAATQEQSRNPSGNSQHVNV